MNSALKSHGFELLTRWTLRNGRIKPETTDWDNCSSWIYSFAFGRSIFYVGIATTVLRSRFDGYSYQINDTVGRNILERLQHGKRVDIYGLRRPGVEKSDLEKEESVLITKYDPPWNVRGKRRDA